MEASGILAALQTPALSNMGKGVLVGIVDSALTSNLLSEMKTAPPHRQDADGHCRRTLLFRLPVCLTYYPMGGASLWNRLPEDINSALASDDHFPLCRQKDARGHGTCLAGLAAGRSFPLQNFTGAALCQILP